MRSARRAAQAEDAASKLSALVRSSRVVDLLQRPPPSEPTAAQQDVLAECSNRLYQLIEALPDRPGSAASAAPEQLLSSVLRQRAAHSASVLLAWLQQQPQQLAAALLSNDDSQVQPKTMGGFWHMGMQAVCMLVGLVGRCTLFDDSSAATAGHVRLVVDITQQLLQSGECRRNKQLLQVRFVGLATWEHHSLYSAYAFTTVQTVAAAVS
jgi:hypothetical protein